MARSKARRSAPSATKATRYFKQFREQGLLEDRSEYDVDDLLSTYPDLNRKDAAHLHFKLKKWRES